MWNYIGLVVIVFLILAAVLATFFYHWLQEDKTFLPRFMREVYERLPDGAKSFIKEKMRSFYDWMYDEATRHNPPGDVAPDSLDNNMKKELKDMLK